MVLNLFFRVQGLDPVLIHRSVKAMELNSHLVIIMASLKHFSNHRQDDEKFLKRKTWFDFILFHFLTTLKVLTKKNDSQKFIVNKTALKQSNKQLDVQESKHFTGFAFLNWADNVT